MNRLNLTADVIVVGSGPGGATVSKKLTESGKKVLLLETLLYIIYMNIYKPNFRYERTVIGHLVSELKNKK